MVCMKKHFINNRTLAAVVVGSVLSFAAGRLVAQPNIVKQKPVAPLDHEKEAFYADLSAAIKGNNHPKILALMDEAAGDGKFTDALVSRSWDMAFNADPQGDRREVLASTFAMKQRQREILLLEQILAELKKSNASKPK
jgi:hypothetical protein